MATTPNLTGLVKVRDYLTGSGQKVDWNSTDGMLVNGTKADTSGMTYANGSYYAKPEQLSALIPSPTPAATPAFTADPNIALLQANLANFKINPFNADTSAEFASYKSKYDDAGNHAMSDTMGQAAAMSGGRASSYSTAVGAQAKASWDQRLMDVIPTLAQNDYNRQMDSFNMLASQLTSLQNADNNNYTRFRNTQADATALEDRNLQRDLSTLGQYSPDYAKEINRRKATPDKSDDYLIPYLTAARNEKVATLDATAKTDAEKAAADDLAQSNWEKTHKLDAANTYSTIANRGTSGSSTSKDITTMGTPEQLSLYSGMMDTFGGNGVSQTYKGTDGIQKAAQYVAMHDVELIQKLGKPLYDRMLAQLRSVDTIVGQPKAPTQEKVEAPTPMIDSPYYSAATTKIKALQSATTPSPERGRDPVPKYDESQIAAEMVTWIRNQPITPEQMAELANALGL
jgi:hypothetical protein